ncbi:hypothetical protein D9M73_203280 [compost metagenome]
MRGDQQFAQVARGRNVTRGEAGRLDEMCIGHSQGSGLGVHSGNERGIAAWIMMGQARGGSVFGRHQGNQQHFPARQFAPEFYPGVHTLHFRRVADVDVDVFVHVLSGFNHDQAGHQLAHGSDGDNDVRIAGIDDFVGLHVQQQRTAGCELELRGVSGRCGGGVARAGNWRDESPCNCKK